MTQQRITQYHVCPNCNQGRVTKREVYDPDVKMWLITSINCSRCYSGTSAYRKTSLVDRLFLSA